MTYWPPRVSVTELNWRYDEFSRLGDGANSAALYGAYAEYQHASLVANGRIDPTLPAIISSFQPKSGGTFLHNRLVGAGYADFSWAVPHHLSAETVYASRSALRLYLKGGCTMHSHLLPHPNILEALQEAEVTTIWVHLRNPCEAIVSSFHHYQGKGQGEGETGKTRVREAEDHARAVDLEVAAGIDAFVKAYLSHAIDWLKSWLEFSRAHPGHVHFTGYRDLKSDPTALLNSVLRRFGATDDRFGDVSTILPTDRFREKQSDDWRDGLLKETIEYAQAATLTGLQRYPEFALIRDMDD